ncbi:MAG: SprB repeat-containing protein, partial [Bacteroidota bacterium]
MQTIASDYDGGSDGTVTASPSGGTVPYTFQWSGGQTTAAINGLLPGTYSVTVTDANGCTLANSTSITQPAALTASSTITTVSCNGGANGSVLAAINGGITPYTFLWSNGQTTNPASNLPAGPYNLTVTDANGCTLVEGAIVSEPSALSVTIASVPTTCFAGSDGELVSNAIGGTMPYTYLWSNGQATATATGLSQGTWTLTITDANGCTLVDSAVVLQPNPVSVSAFGSDTLCPGDSAAIFGLASGDSGPFTYSWNQGLGSGGGHTVTPAITTAYSVTATDAVGCTSNPATVLVHVRQPDFRPLNIVSSGGICRGEAAQFVGVYDSTGTDVTFQWNNFLGQSLGPHTVSPTQTTNYILTITDACGLTISDTVTIRVDTPPSVGLSTDSITGCVDL